MMPAINLSKFSLLLAIVCSLSCHTQQKSATLKNPKPEDGSGAYATGKYRNLFAENGYNEKDITTKIYAAYQQLFHGDTSQTIYFEAGKNENGPLAYVSDVPHNDIRSEGMSYGMIISVELNKKADFDAIWNYAMTYMYESRPEHPSEGYFHWSLK
jgi:oligosaccharide reducing-end xylanase